MEGRIKTLHPDPGKHGVHVLKGKYEQVRAAILSALDELDVMSFMDLEGAAADKLGSTFQGSISWYVTTVKLDLEARNRIERVPGERPQILRMVRDT
jgi:hypothetical protein